jgi:NAD+ kinase
VEPHQVRRVGIVVKPRLDGGPRVVRDLVSWLTARDIAPILDEASAAIESSGTHRTVAADALPAECDLIVVLGGDGTLLATARRIALAAADIAVLAVNFGSLGFLTETTLPELYPALDRVIAGDAAFETRMMLRMRILRGGVIRHESPVLNDVVVNRGPLSRMTDLSVSADELFVARFKADGLIVATPTGSTAYNLSAGGPIVHPHLDAIVLTPIAPHTLTNRPVVMPATAALTIQPLIAGGEDIFVTADGQTGYPLSAADLVTVSRAERALRLVRSTERSYFGVLRQKLKWAERSV